MKTNKMVLGLVISMLVMLLPSLAIATVDSTSLELTQLTRSFDIKVEIIYFIRVITAFIFGCIIGLFHDRSRQWVGLKTYGSVALGASIFSVISLHIFFVYNNIYAINIAAGIVTGVGFLGAGVIFKEGNSVRGLPAAATIWATAAIGLACGMGAFILAIAGTILISLFHLFSRLNPAGD